MEELNNKKYQTSLNPLVDSGKNILGAPWHIHKKYDN